MMSGEWMALGAVALLAAAGAVRARGSLREAGWNFPWRVGDTFKLAGRDWRALEVSDEGAVYAEDVDGVEQPWEFEINDMQWATLTSPVGRRL